LLMEGATRAPIIAVIEKGIERIRKAVNALD
jgi:hypothetical protein